MLFELGNEIFAAGIPLNSFTFRHTGRWHKKCALQSDRQRHLPAVRLARNQIRGVIPNMTQQNIVRHVAHISRRTVIKEDCRYFVDVTRQQ